MRLQLSLLLAVLLAPAGGDLATQVQAQTVPNRPGLSRRTEEVLVVQRVSPAVVNIHSERSSAEANSPLESFALTAPPGRTNGMGTGVIIDPRGYIITNQHVVEDVNVIRVRLFDGSTVSARVVARDNEMDLALLKVDVGRPLPVIPLGTSSDLMEGERVVAIGNAYGYPHSTSTGNIAALKRDVTLNKDMAYKNLIQHTAPINPGNSGGPLLNIRGEMIGVNVAIRAGANCIGFAIPVDAVLRTAADMMSIRRRKGTWHGLVTRDEVLVQRDGESTTRRLIVEQVEAGSPAAKAGIQRGDIIAQVGDQRVCCALELERALLDHPAGQCIALGIHRNGRDERASMVLQTIDRYSVPASDLAWRKIGVRLSPVRAELVSNTNPQLHGGLTVVEVRPDSAASKAGIQRGDILVGLHQWEMLSVENVNFVLNHADLASFSPLRFYIVRAGQVHRGWLQQID